MKPKLLEWKAKGKKTKIAVKLLNKLFDFRVLGFKRLCFKQLYNTCIHGCVFFAD